MKIHKTFENKEQSWRIYTNQFQTIHKARQYGIDIRTDIQINRKGSPKTDPHKYHKLISNKNAMGILNRQRIKKGQEIQKGKDNLQQISKKLYPKRKTMNLDPHATLHTHQVLKTDHRPKYKG